MGNLTRASPTEEKIKTKKKNQALNRRKKIFQVRQQAVSGGVGVHLRLQTTETYDGRFHTFVKVVSMSDAHCSYLFRILKGELKNKLFPARRLVQLSDPAGIATDYRKLETRRKLKS